MNAVAEDIVKTLEKSVVNSRKSSRWFIKNILNQLDQCDEWQIEVCEAVLDVWRKANKVKTVVNHKGLNRITIRSCHGPGKTHLLALILHLWNYCFYGLVLVTAPKQEQIKTRFMLRYRKIRSEAIEDYKQLQKVDSLKATILNDPNWGFVCSTASEPENMAGFHDEPQLILVDEASARSLDMMFPVVEGSLTTKGSVLVIIGNPTRLRGEFWASHNKKETKALYYKVHVKPDMSRYVDKEWLRNMATKYGKNSPVYKVRCLGEFVEQEENQLLALSWIEESRHRWEADGSVPILRISCDVADGGANESVITVAKVFDSFTVLLKMARFSFPQGKANVMLADAIVAMAEAFDYDVTNGDDVIVDVIGVGAGVPGILLKKDMPFNIVSFKGGSTENIDTKRWRNQRVKCFLAMRDAFRDEELIIDPNFCSDTDWEDFLGQLCSIKIKPGLEKYEDLEGKQEMKRRGVDSPDMADSSSMIFTSMSPKTSYDNFNPIIVETMRMANEAW